MLTHFDARCAAASAAFGGTGIAHNKFIGYM